MKDLYNKWVIISIELAKERWKKSGNQQVLCEKTTDDLGEFEHLRALSRALQVLNCLNRNFENIVFLKVNMNSLYSFDSRKEW